MWRFVVCMLMFWVIVVSAQTYGPSEGYYGGIHLQFSGQIQLNAGTCSRTGNQVECTVPEGAIGRIQLVATATRTPTGALTVYIQTMEKPTGWPSLQPSDHVRASGSGSVTVDAFYQFTVPTGSAGRSFRLWFQAYAAGGPRVDLFFVLNVTRPVTPAPPSEYPSPPTTPPTVEHVTVTGRLTECTVRPLPNQPFTMTVLTTGAGGNVISGRTDANGRFEIAVPTIASTFVTGKLTECPAKVLANASVSVALVPKPGVTAITRVDQIAAMRVSSPGYGEKTVSQFTLLSSRDIFGRTYVTVELGTVCLEREKAMQSAVAPGISLSGVTDAEGRFTLTLQVPGEIIGFKFSAPGYKDITVTRFSKISILGLTSYLLGDMCLQPAEEVQQPMPKPKLLLLSVAERSFAPVYFLQQTVDEILRFRIEAVAGSKVEALRAKLVCLPVTQVYAVGPNTHVALPEEWLIEQLEYSAPDIAANWDKVKEAGWGWELPVPFEGAFGKFETLVVERRDRVESTPINEDTWFRIQEKELDKLQIKGGIAAIGYWELEASVRTPDGVLHHVRSAFCAERKIPVIIVQEDPTGKDEEETIMLTVRFPHLYQVFRNDVLVYELKSTFQSTMRATETRKPTVIQHYSLVKETLEMRDIVTPTQIDLFAKVDIRSYFKPSPELILGGNVMIIGNPLKIDDLANAEIATPPFYICPAVGDDDLPIECESEIEIIPQSGTYEGEVTQGFATGSYIAEIVLGEVISNLLTLGKIIPTTWKELAEWLIGKAFELSAGKIAETGVPKIEKIIEGHGLVYQALKAEAGDPQRYYAGNFSFLAPNTKAEGYLGEEKIACRWKSTGRPRYRMTTGAAVGVIVVGKPEDIKNFVATAKVKVKLHEEGVGGRWLIRDKGATVWYTWERDPNPNSTWK